MNALSPIFDMAWVWLVAGAVAMLLEIVVAGVYLFWIGLGAMLTGLVLFSLPRLPLWAQITVFIVAMFASIGIGIWGTRRQKANMASATLNSGMKALLGQSAIAIDAFAHGQGRIRVQDTSYPARLEQGDVKAGDRVEIVGLEGGCYIVKPG